MEDRLARVSALLHEAGETHHAVYRRDDGNDPDWASWYADWLVNRSELPQILGVTPVRSELVYLLVGLDREYVAGNQDRPWERVYAEAILRTFAGRDDETA
jgi:hypothetical protein